MAYQKTFSVEVAGLKEFTAYLRALGTDPNLIKDANQLASVPVLAEIARLVPRKSGRLAASVKVNRAINELRITVGNNTTVRYGYNFHAQDLGRSGGYFTIKVPGTPTRRAYNRTTAIRNYPFMRLAAENKSKEVLAGWITAMDDLARQYPPAAVVI